MFTLTMKYLELYAVDYKYYRRYFMFAIYNLTNKQCFIFNKNPILLFVFIQNFPLI